MPSFGMLRRVVLVRTDVSEEYIASIIQQYTGSEVLYRLLDTTNESCHSDDGSNTLLRIIGFYKFL
jgi:hypothetical protein